MLNGIFIFLIVGSVLVGAFNGRMQEVSDSGLNAAKTSVELAIGLIGQMALWLGFMRVVREAGLMASLGNALRPVMARLFRDVPSDHPAMGAMIMNLAANMLGLGNAATPFGLKAMKELDKLNPHPGVATNSMALFLAINTSGVAVLPLGAIAVRATLGSKDAAGIFVPTLLATMCSTVAAIIIAKLIERSKTFAPERYLDAGAAADLEKRSAAAAEPIKGMDEAEKVAAAGARWSPIRTAFFGLVMLALAAGAFRWAQGSSGGAFDVAKALLSSWILPVLMVVIVLVGFGRGVKVYETFVQGAKEGFDIAVIIIPYLVAILVAVGMFRASGSLDLIVSVLGPATNAIGFPAETLPMALMRPLSGSGALGVMSEIMKTYGPDSFPGFVASVMNGSCETTFYVLALYYGSVQVRATRHTLIPCLTADLVGLTLAVYWSRLFWTAM